jgi:hypothetical protein
MKRGLAAIGLAAAMFAANDAHAIELGTPSSTHPYRSAQNFAFELRFSPYKPQIDEEPGLANAPYHQTFGSMRRLLIQLELDWQTFRIPHLGTIGPGLSVGYTSMSEVVKTVSGRPSGDETALDVFPFYGVAVLRADVLWRELGIPFVPYAKGGMAMGLWRATNTGETAVANNVSGKGTTWGLYAAGGVALALDALDLGASRNMDNATGINNTYFFLEAYWLGLNGIGQTDALRIGTVSWAAGLAFEF